MSKMLSGTLALIGKMFLAYLHLNLIEFVTLSASETSLVRSVMEISCCHPFSSLMYTSFERSNWEMWLACSKESIKVSTSYSYADLSP